jgi:hypothetical protein
VVPVLRSCLIYAFAASVERLRPASVAGITRGLTGYIGFMRQLLEACEALRVRAGGMQAEKEDFMPFHEVNWGIVNLYKKTLQRLP